MLFWLKKKYKEYGNISTKEFTNEIKKKHPNLKNEPEKIIKIAKFSIKEYFYNNTIEYKVDAFSHKDTLENFTGNCIIRARMLEGVTLKKPKSRYNTTQKNRWIKWT